MKKDTTNWWKWGNIQHSQKLDDLPELKSFIEKKWSVELSPLQSECHQIAVDDIDENQKTKFRSIFHSLNQSEIIFDNDSRILNCIGQSYQDVYKAFNKLDLQIPDCVLYPATHEQVQQVLTAASEENIKIIPFGGGSNVTGAFQQPESTDKKLRVCCLNLKNMDKMISIDHHNMKASFQTGIFGPELEKILNSSELSLGHFPQSFEYSTLGGWLATRSAGQESTLHGKIEDLVLSMKIATPSGTIQTSGHPADASGINLNHIFLGSEGIFGIITEATIKIHPLPLKKDWIVALFKNFDEGIATCKEMLQKGVRPSIIRLSDPVETRLLSLVSSKETGLKQKAKDLFKKAFMKLKKLDNPCILMLRLDDSGYGNADAVKFTTDLIGENKGTLLGDKMGIKWESSRYHLPYLRDTLIEHGVMIDTLETVTDWNNIIPLYNAVKEALKNNEAFRKDSGIVVAHLSHLYPSGACIYFTMITPKGEKDGLLQWKSIKKCVLDIFIKHKAAVSHHHGIGTDHQDWFIKTTDNLGLEILKSIKERLDPQGILNPGKLFDKRASKSLTESTPEQISAP